MAANNQYNRTILNRDLRVLIEKNKNVYYVYCHKYNDVIIYIGCGKNYRALYFQRNQQYNVFVSNVGRENIVIEIIKFFDSKKEAIKFEDELHQQHQNLYSKSISSDSRWKKKLQESKKGKINIQENNGMFQQPAPNRKSIVKLDNDYNIIKEYDYIGEAQQDGFVRNHIRRSCQTSGEKTYKSFRWMFREDYDGKFKEI